MSPYLRVVHYLNQFFGGIGGEEKASVGPRVKEESVALGRAIENILKERGKIVATVICGDNYFAEQKKKALQEVIDLITTYQPDIVIAGPAFNAGRYGIACGEICKEVEAKLKVPAVTGMYEENPGVDIYQKDIYIVKTADSAKDTEVVISRMVNIALKLWAKDKIGKPADEGYFPRGIIKNEPIENSAAERVIDMLLAKIKGQPFETELELPKFDYVNPANAIKNLSSVKVALVTDGGLVLKGNPDKMESHKSTRFCVYDIKELSSLSPQDFEANHMGYDRVFVNQDPNRLVPLDVMRDLEKEKVIGKLHNKIYSTAGVGTSLYNAKNIGQGIAQQLKSDGVGAAILTST
jgi:glycine reductase